MQEVYVDAVATTYVVIGRIAPMNSKAFLGAISLDISFTDLVYEFLTFSQTISLVRVDTISTCATWLLLGTLLVEMGNGF